MSGSEKFIESQQAEPALRQSEEHNRAVAEAATDAIIAIDSFRTTTLSINSYQGLIETGPVKV